jgi:hypothetical protein
MSASATELRRRSHPTAHRYMDLAAAPIREKELGKISSRQALRFFQEKSLTDGSTNSKRGLVQIFS